MATPSGPERPRASRSTLSAVVLGHQVGTAAHSPVWGSTRGIGHTPTAPAAPPTPDATCHEATQGRMMPVGCRPRSDVAPVAGAACGPAWRAFPRDDSRAGRGGTRRSGSDEDDLEVVFVRPG